MGIEVVEAGLATDARHPLAASAEATMEDLAELGTALNSLTRGIKKAIFEPAGVKTAPTFNATQIAGLCGKTIDQMKRLLEKAEDRGLPTGLQPVASASTSRARVFTLAEARAWVRAEGDMHRRGDGVRGATVVVGNFKGGVGKTVLAGSLAQGLSLRGYKVLCIDYDPQGSLTSLFGLIPTDIEEHETVMPLMVPRDADIARDTLQESIRPTYWDGVDLVPGNLSLFGAEFFLPNRQMHAPAHEPGFLFVETLTRALDQGVREEYDYIIIDTPPALSYMTMTTFWAADALLMPLPPEGLDFVSSGQFFGMLAELATGFTDERARGKRYAWLGVVPSKVDKTKMHTKEIMNWMQEGFGRHLLRTEIPETAAVSVGGMELKSVYDISRYVGSQKTLLRAREAYDKVVDEVDHLTRNTLWRGNATQPGAL
jgi:chromosome partitioning protein